MKKNKYLLDTNICIALLRGNRDIAQKLISIGEGNCAATALSGDYVLVTDNVKHFQRITGLEIENWIKR